MGPGIGLPQPLEDQAISGEVSKIGNLIKNHVQSYYHSRVVNAGLIDLDDITALGHHLPVSVGTLSTLLDNTETREAALRFCIAFAVVSRLQSYEISSLSLLPPGICASLRETTTVESSSKGKMKSHFLVPQQANSARSNLYASAVASCDCRIDVP